MVSPLEHPEAQDLFRKLVGMLGEESDRGLVLVGASHVDQCLRGLIEAVMPSSMNAKARRRLLNYPGSLSSLAARADAALAFRLIPEDIHEALTALRELRNELAHNPEAFTLRGKDRYFRIYAIGPDVPHGIRRMALELMFKAKLDAGMKVIRKFEEEHPETEKWTEKRLIEHISDNREIMDAMETQLPHWELIIGISLLASMIVFHRERAVSVLEGIKTIGGVAKLPAPSMAPS